jgi:hypothetical protein
MYGRKFVVIYFNLADPFRLFSGICLLLRLRLGSIARGENPLPLCYTWGVQNAWFLHICQRLTQKGAFIPNGVSRVMKKDWSQAGWIAFLPLFAVVILYATEMVWRTSFFLCQGGNCKAPIPESIWNVLKIEVETSNPSASTSEQAKLTALQYGGRLTWYLLGEIYLFVCIAALMVALVLIYQLMPQRPLLWTLASLVLSLSVGSHLYANPHVHMAVFLVMLEKTITRDVPAIASMTNLLNSLGNAAAFALLLASCTTLLPSHQEPSPEGIKYLSKHMKALRLVLYTGTILLVGTMLLKKAIFQWGLAYTSQDEVALEAAKLFVTSLLALDGGFYTLVLAASYLPAVLVLQRRTQFLTDLPAEEPEREKKLKEHGMIFSWADSFPRILAILGPFLVGPVGELLNAILK